MRDNRGGIAAAAMYTQYPQYPQYPAVAAQSRDDKLSKSVKDPLLALVRWLKRRNPTEKMVLIGLSAVVVRVGPCPPFKSDTASHFEVSRCNGLLPSAGSDWSIASLPVSTGIAQAQGAAWNGLPRALPLKQGFLEGSACMPC